MILVIFILLKLNRSFLIRSILDNDYMTLKKEDRKHLTFSPNIHDAVEFILVPSNNGNVFLKDARERSKSLDVAKKDKLIMYKFHGAHNQQLRLSLIGDNLYNIMHSDKCITRESKDNLNHLKKCTDSTSQIFEIIGPLILPLHPDIAKPSYSNEQYADEPDSKPNPDFDDPRLVEQRFIDEIPQSHAHIKPSYAKERYINEVMYPNYDPLKAFATCAGNQHYSD